MSDSKRSMTNWAMQTHHTAPAAADNTRLQEVARRLYDRDVPTPTAPQLSESGQVAHITYLERLHDQMGRRGTPFQIAPQSDDRLRRQDRLSPVQNIRELMKGGHRLREALAYEFAYRILPNPARPKAPDQSSSRLTMNIDPRYSRHAAHSLSRLVTQQADNPTVTQAKIMGPDKLGQRTDDAVLYMRGHDDRKARQTAANLSAMMDPQGMVEHTPFGMTRLGTGISYAETVGGDSTSHGSARKKIIAAAVAEFRRPGITHAGNEQEMSGRVGYQAYRHGYNPEAPAYAVRQSRKDMLSQIRDLGANLSGPLKPSDVKRTQAIARAHGLDTTQAARRVEQENVVKRTGQTIGRGASETQGFIKKLMQRYKV